MNDSNDQEIGVDRRTALGSMAAVALGTVGAGCLDGSSGGTDAESVSIEPVGALPAERTAPDSWIGGRDMTVDVAVCLDELDSMDGMIRPEDTHLQFYDALGIDVDLSDVTNIEPESHQINKELVYEVNPDVVAVDPNRLVVNNGLEVTDIEELAENVAPFFGNYSREAREGAWPNWPDGEYNYYEFSELMLKYGELFGQRDRMEEIVSFREDVVADVTDRLPPESERPRVALLLWFPDPETSSGYRVYNTVPKRKETYGQMQYRQLGAREAFGEDVHEAGATVEVGEEAMAEADPDVVILNFGLGNEEDASDTADVLRDRPVTSGIGAVENDRIHIGGVPYQGPITSLYQFEMLAKQLYPGEFGEFHGIGNIPESEWLFDRAELGELIGTE